MFFFLHFLRSKRGLIGRIHELLDDLLCLSISRGILTVKTHSISTNGPFCFRWTDVFLRKFCSFTLMVKAKTLIFNFNEPMVNAEAKALSIYCIADMWARARWDNAEVMLMPLPLMGREAREINEKRRRLPLTSFLSPCPSFPSLVECAGATEREGGRWLEWLRCRCAFPRSVPRLAG